MGCSGLQQSINFARRKTSNRPGVQASAAIGLQQPKVRLELATHEDLASATDLRRDLLGRKRHEARHQYQKPDQG